MAYKDPYDEYLQQIAQGGSVPPAQTPAPAPAGGSQALGWAGLGLDTVGSLLGAYGQAEQASQARSDELKREGRTMVRQDRQDSMDAEDRNTHNLQSNGDYAGKSLEELLRNYGAYNRSIGR